MDTKLPLVFMVKINEILNGTINEIEERQYNIFIGISLGNKYFTKEHIKSYLKWALDHTKDKVALIIADKIQAINYEVRNGYSKERAMKVSLKLGNRIKEEVQQIISSFPKKDQNRIVVLHWEEIETKKHLEQVSILFKEFNSNKEFYNEIINIVKENIKSLNESEYEKLAHYVLNELPTFINGCYFNNELYNLIIYPGLGGIDYLSIGLQTKTKYRELSERLEIKNKVIIIEGYAE